MDLPADTPFAFGRFSRDGHDVYDGVIVGDRVIALSDTPAAGKNPVSDTDEVVDILARWLAKEGSDAGSARSGLTTHAPVAPGQVFCSGANYRTHVIDLVVAQQVERQPGEDLDTLRERAAKSMDERAAQGDPYVFLGLPAAVCGPDDDIVLPWRGEQHDWELELGVVIGRPARNVSRADALEYVAGYTIVNDVTTRDLVFRPDVPGIGTDWLASKNSPTFSPTGPYLVPARFVDPLKLRVVLRLNGEVMQDGETSDMIFDVARLIEYVSAITELRPGDLLMTGSPAGNGAHYGRFLAPGDVLEGEISGLGTQHNRCVRS